MFSNLLDNMRNKAQEVKAAAKVAYEETKINATDLFNQMYSKAEALPGKIYTKIQESKVNYQEDKITKEIESKDNDAITKEDNNLFEKIYAKGKDMLGFLSGKVYKKVQEAKVNYQENKITEELKVIKDNAAAVIEDKNDKLSDSGNGKFNGKKITFSDLMQKEEEEEIAPQANPIKDDKNIEITILKEEGEIFIPQTNVVQEHFNYDMQNELYKQAMPISNVSEVNAEQDFMHN